VVCWLRRAAAAGWAAVGAAGLLWAPESSGQHLGRWAAVGAREQRLAAWLRRGEWRLAMAEERRGEQSGGRRKRRGRQPVVAEERRGERRAERRRATAG
jgi:hypothetical protein